MGLDIYLQRYDDYQKSKDLEKRYNDYSEEVWGENAKDGNYEKLTDEQKNEFREKERIFAESLGLDKYGSHTEGVESIEIDSIFYPDHYFKIGYFRSSYNEGGIQRILKNLDLPDLNYILDREEGEYEFQPNWGLSLVRVQEVIEKLSKAGNYRVHHVSNNIFSPNTQIKNEKDALKVFLEEVNRNNKSDYNYSNATGEYFFHEPLKVLGLIPGTFNLIREMDCVYVVTEADNEWYVNALEIVKETIEYVLSKENKEQYYLRWSG